MRETKYVDPQGRYHAVLLPDGAPDSDASMGIPLGPPSLAALNLPESLEVLLHNQLYSRRIFTWQDAKKRRQDVVGALQGALKIDAERILELYLIQANGDNEHKATDAIPKGRVKK